MFWGFAVPIVHLACGTTLQAVEVLCETHETAAESRADQTHAANHGDHQNVHSAGSALPVHPVTHSSTDVERQDALVECCLFDARATDHRAALVDLNHVPAPIVTPVDEALSEDAPVLPVIVEPDPSPPVAYRLLFSVFLI